MNRILLASVALWILSFVSSATSRSAEEHPRYTAARLTDEYKHILDGKVKLAESPIFTHDITVDDCGKGGHYEYLSDKLEELIPKLEQVDLSVKFAYPVPFTNHSIQFSVDEVLTLKNGEVQTGEKAFFARLEEKDNDYKIYDIRVVPCLSE